jgi:hypothetical protein
MLKHLRELSLQCGLARNAREWWKSYDNEGKRAEK